MTSKKKVFKIINFNKKLEKYANSKTFSVVEDSGFEYKSVERIFDHIEKVAKIPSVLSEYFVREYIIKQLKLINRTYRVDKVGNVYVLPKNESKVLLSAHMDKQAKPNYYDSDSSIVGKLDDAIGIGIILALLKNNNFHGLFTIGEERGLLGSKYAVKNDLIPSGVDKAVVIDVSPRPPKKGVQFYSSFNNKRASINLVEIVVNIAKSLNVNIQPMSGAINDGTILIRKIKDTIAFESYIDNFHSSNECCQKKEIIDIYRIVEGILTI